MNDTPPAGWGLPVRLVGSSLLSLVFAGVASLSVWGQTTTAKPTVWMGPPSYDQGKCLRELFEHPDTWPETRSVVDVLTYADHWLHKQFTDDELRAWFSQMQQCPTACWCAGARRDV